MKLYADTTARRTAQILTDLLVLGWVALWWYLGRVLHDATLELMGPARQLQSAGEGFRSTMSDAGTTLQRVPVVGDELEQPFRQVAGTGTTIANAGRDLGTAVEHLALILGLLTALVPIVLVLGIWLLLRLRFARRATAAQRFIDADADLDLFALRAMTRQPMHKIARISDDPARAWRAGEQPVIRALALLELRDSGLRPPALSR